MTVILNGTATDVADDAVVADAVVLLTTESAGVAVAVNDGVVPRSAWAETPLEAGDRVEILTAVQGG